MMLVLCPKRVDPNRFLARMFAIFSLFMEFLVPFDPRNCPHARKRLHLIPSTLTPCPCPSLPHNLPSLWPRQLANTNALYSSLSPPPPPKPPSPPAQRKPGSNCQNSRLPVLPRTRVTDSAVPVSDSNDQEKWRRIEGDEEEEEATRGNE